jgi:hypothetical protein
MSELAYLTDEELKALCGDDFALNLDKISDEELRGLVGDEVKEHFIFWALYPGSREAFWGKFAELRYRLRTTRSVDFACWQENHDLFCLGEGERVCYGKVNPVADFPGLCDIIISGDRDVWHRVRNSWLILKNGLGILTREDEKLVEEIKKAPIQPGISLSKREMQVLKLYSNGQKQLEISRELHISVGTVKKHRMNIVEKFRKWGDEVKGIGKVIEIALEIGLLR